MEKTKIVTVRNIPESIHKAIRIMAAHKETSINQIIVDILIDAVEEGKDTANAQSD